MKADLFDCGGMPISRCTKFGKEKAMKLAKQKCKITDHKTVKSLCESLSTKKRCPKLKSPTLSSLVTISQDEIVLNNGTKFFKKEKLGEGSYGIVESYKSEDGQVLAVKKTKDKKEVKIIQYLHDNSIDCGVIPTKLAENKSSKFLVVMPQINGDFFELITKNLYSRKDIELLLYKIATKLNCLQNHDMYYLDLKVENILFSSNEKTCVKNIYLGDIGSIYKIGYNTHAIMTYVPYRFINSPKMVDGRAHIWGICLLWVTLYLQRVPSIFCHTDGYVNKKVFIKTLSSYNEIPKEIRTILIFYLSKVIKYYEVEDKKYFNSLFTSLTYTLKNMALE